MQLCKDEIDLLIDKIKEHLRNIREYRNYEAVAGLLAFINGYNYMSERLNKNMFTALSTKCVGNNVIVSIHAKSKVGSIYITEPIAVVSMKECNNMSD